MTDDDAPEITVNVTQEIIDRARREGLSGAQMIALAIAEAVPGREGDRGQRTEPLVARNPADTER